MTRINSSIPVHSLTDEHLLAEHREIKRLPYCLGKSICSMSISHIPETFTLGKGHVLFFVDKQKFIYNRYREIFGELLRRGFKPTPYFSNWNGMEATQYWKDHNPTDQEHDMLVYRIAERINNSPKKIWHHYRKPISREEAVGLLKT